MSFGSQVRAVVLKKWWTLTRERKYLAYAFLIPFLCLAILVFLFLPLEANQPLATVSPRTLIEGLGNRVYVRWQPSQHVTPPPTLRPLLVDDP